MCECTLVSGDTNPLSKKIRDMLGVGDYDKVKCLFSQCERVDGKVVTYIPSTVEEYDALKNAPDDILLDIGLRQWDEDIWLFPKEWYDYIPDRYEVVDIRGNTKKFKLHVCSDGIRLGCLPYGFIKTKEGEDEN